MLTAAALIIFLMAYFSMGKPEATTSENTTRALSACAGFICLAGLVIFPNGPFVRPHPLVWRLAFGFGLVYQLGMIFILFQNKDDARQFLKIFNEDLGQPLAHKSYAENCALTFPNLWDATFDLFFVAHFMGWFLKSLQLRDPVLCWIISIQWELIELMFMHWLPNFAECWWDQLILDILLANGCGIFCGHLANRYFQTRMYDWGGEHSTKSYRTIAGKLKRGILQLQPASWISMNWEVGVLFLFVLLL
jgi:phosphatidylserine synthase 2